MCEELNEELKEGANAAKRLAEHLENMGCVDKASIPVTTDSGCYMVEIRKTL